MNIISQSFQGFELKICFSRSKIAKLKGSSFFFADFTARGRHFLRDPIFENNIMTSPKVARCRTSEICFCNFIGKTHGCIFYKLVYGSKYKIKVRFLCFMNIIQKVKAVLHLIISQSWITGALYFPVWIKLLLYYDVDIEHKSIL